ncbi:FGGY-family carbohydrate kinase [Rhodobacteraceae bacterium N5(2021)]|uniref:FGGY-family carbohydrate kinase n=1 Tax=Gymnodinialimonas phycosphaerae TaxID=2841589 RepID=A0A975TW17_9RHOB|nr:FGGY-family carbohydrate kinase [Gymnodinialimonas phycosphaerae]MBY4892005.1 FGGY-family carbohydrate kinase [Gymnodinialimonas phycosphaerae]
MSHIAVIDIGKSNAKLALVDRVTFDEVAVVTRPNIVSPGPPWPHFDLEGHWAFLLDSLRDFHASHGIDAISITAHGASCVLLDANGNLAAPMLDYEHPGPDDLTEAYDLLRSPFAETGSARLAGGLNIGAQLHWMFDQDPGLREKTAQILTYPQFWAYRLTGVATTERTSLGCHTDLWNPSHNSFSPLVAALGIAGKMAPVRMASDVLGTILPDVARQTGLPITTPVTCGIHDSNASLLPHLMTRKTPFSVVSTGTWVIAMTIGGREPQLDEDRDTLVNVNAHGDPTPSARFMGGREFETVIDGTFCAPTPADRKSVLDQPVMLLPSSAPLTGPFKGRTAKWRPYEPPHGSGQRSLATSYYLAMVTAECLKLTGHIGDIIVEGPFATNRDYLDMLAVATRCPVLATNNATGTSQGAARLVAGTSQEPPQYSEHQPFETDALLSVYAQSWTKAINDHDGMAINQSNR